MTSMMKPLAKESWPLLAINYLCKRRTAQKMKFSIKDVFGKCDQILRKLRICHIYWRNP